MAHEPSMIAPEIPDQNPSPTHQHPGEISIEYGRSVVRLRLRDWIAVAVILLSLAGAAPMICNFWEGSPANLDGRIPYSASEDYWTFRRRLQSSLLENRIPMIGDSVIWGDYVSADQTLSAHLNADADSPRFANAGVNGVHPLALQGLVEYYAADLHDRPVLLHCNLLWLSSLERDLQTRKDVPINHTRLIPQVWPRIPAYRANFAQRLGLVIDRSVPFFDCVTHLRKRYFDGQDLQSWSLAHPYDNPLRQFSKPLTTEPEELRHRPVPWTEQGIGLQDMPWVDLTTSLQWAAWRRTLETLQSRRNRVLVLVGPLNEHLLQEASRRKYQSLKQDVVDWLNEHNIASFAPEALPSEDYGDASHPLSAGYARLADQMRANAVFREWNQANNP